MTTWVQALSVYKQPKMLAMTALGFSAGLPLLLVFGTLSYWLRQEGIDRSTIGYISWVALVYGLKFLWSPLVDRMPIPILSSLFGQRRAWMLLAQLSVAGGLFLMSSADPQTQLQLLIVSALIVAFSSATQDISLDAWRIESAPVSEQGAMAATYQLGYRLGMILAGGGAYSLAEFYSWNSAYFVMSLAMSVGIITTLLVAEPSRRNTDRSWLEEPAVISVMRNTQGIPYGIRYSFAWLVGAVICPFAEFFKRNGYFAILLLLFIGVFRLSDITMGVMSGPFYADAGYTAIQVGLVSKTFGVGVTIAGALLGGVLLLRYGVVQVLVLAAILVAITNLVFAWLATQEPKTYLLATVITADNLSGGIAGSAFIAYLSGLTSRAYTATQYALLSSFMLLPAKFIGGFSGEVVDAYGYVDFFLYAAALGIPAIILATFLWFQSSRESADLKRQTRIKNCYED